MKSRFRTVVVLALVALVVAVLRYFMRGWMETLGWPLMVGSLLASVTIVLLVGLVVIFAREGRDSKGWYLRAAGWFVLLTAWCQALVIAGIVITARAGAATYYDEMMGGHRTLPPLQHASAHVAGFFVEAALGLILGLFVYLAARRGRRSPQAAAG